MSDELDRLDADPRVTILGNYQDAEPPTPDAGWL
jgi:hypothetical protein